MSNLTLLKDFDVKNIDFKYGKGAGSGMETVWLSKDRKPIILQLSDEFVTTPFGCAEGYRSDIQSKRRTLDIHSDYEMEEKIKEIESYIIRRCNSDHRIIGNPETFEFKSMVKGEHDSRYDTTIRTKLTVGRAKVMLDGGLKEGSIEDVTNKVELKVICELRCLWKKDRMFGVTFEVRGILIKQKTEKSYDFI